MNCKRMINIKRLPEGLLYKMVIASHVIFWIYTTAIIYLYTKDYNGTELNWLFVSYGFVVVLELIVLLSCFIYKARQMLFSDFKLKLIRSIGAFFIMCITSVLIEYFKHSGSMDISSYIVGNLVLALGWNFGDLIFFKPKKKD